MTRKGPLTTGCLRHFAATGAVDWDRPAAITKTAAINRRNPVNIAAQRTPFCDEYRKFKTATPA